MKKVPEISVTKLAATLLKVKFVHIFLETVSSSVFESYVVSMSSAALDLSLSEHPIIAKKGSIKISKIGF